MYIWLRCSSDDYVYMAKVLYGGHEYVYIYGYGIIW